MMGEDQQTYKSQQILNLRRNKDHLKTYFKKSVENPSGPGDFSDCVDDMAALISSWVINASRYHLVSGDSEGISTELKNLSISVKQVVESDVYSFE